MSSSQNPNLSATDVEYIFKGIDYSAGAGGLLQEKKYEFRIEATVSGQSQPVESAPFRTVTHPPLVFGPPVVTQQDGWLTENLPIRLESFTWTIAGGAHVRLGATSWGPDPEPTRAPDKKRYTFAIVAPEATGVQIGSAPINPNPTGDPNHVAQHHEPCKWGNNWPQSDTSALTEWNGHVHLIRCGFGDGTTPITVRVRNTVRVKNNVTPQDYYEWDALTIRLPQPWHDADHKLRYRIGCTPTPATPTADLNYEDAIDAGASAWNNAKLGVEFEKLNPTGGCAVTHRRLRIVVEHYNDPSNPRCDPLPSGSHPPACARSVDGVFPHMVAHELIINDRDYQWSSDADSNQMILRHEFYLPWVAAHELGHTAGLGHNADSRAVMFIPAPQGKVINPLLTGSDESAMESIYKTHVDH